MLQLVISDSQPVHGIDPAGEYGAWTGYRIPQERAGWHPLVREFYDYWVSAAPAGQLPGRQHIRPEEVPGFLSRMFMLDIVRDPLRYRYRLCGTELVRSLGREVTGMWLDKAHPQLLENPESRERFRLMVETGRPTWRKGTPLWARHPDHRSLETCIVPLAGDGMTVDKLLGFCVFFDSQGRVI